MNNADIVMPEQFLLGHMIVDTQHGLLFAIYDELLRAIDGGEDAFQLDLVCRGLEAYVKVHFAHEEALMVASRYSGMDMHVAEHKLLTNSVADLKNRLDGVSSPNEEKEIAKEIARFLHEWLTGHIAEVDRALCNFLAEQS